MKPSRTRGLAVVACAAVAILLLWGEPAPDHLPSAAAPVGSAASGAELEGDDEGTWAPERGTLSGYFDPPATTTPVPPAEVTAPLAEAAPNEGIRTIGGAQGRVPEGFHPEFHGNGAAGADAPELLEARPTTQGSVGLSHEAVQRLVRQHAGNVAQCRPRADRSPAQRILVQFDILRDGSVSNLQGSADQVDRQIVDCVVRTFGRLRFRPLDDAPLHIRYPVVLG